MLACGDGGAARLFDEYERTDSAPASHAEPSFSFLNQTTTKASTPAAAPTTVQGNPDEPKTKPKASKPVLPKLGSYSRAKSELRDKFKKRVVQLDRFDGTLMVGIKADDSGVFPKTQIKTAAQDAFRQVYKDAAYAPRQMIIEFHGPLVNKGRAKSRTGSGLCTP